MKKRKVIIIHGSNSTEEDSKESPPENERHWKPWLKKELEKEGYEVSNELYPKDWMPDYEKWKAIFEKNKINEDTILIGHSAGTAFILRWLAENKKKVDKIILVAPSIIKWGKYRDGLSKLKDFRYDSSLKNYFHKIIIFCSNDDDEDIIESAKQVHVKLGGNLIELKERGHFTFEDMGTEKFPELLKEILK